MKKYNLTLCLFLLNIYSNVFAGGPDFSSDYQSDTPATLEDIVLGAIVLFVLIKIWLFFFPNDN